MFIFTQGGRILNLAYGATLADAAAVLGMDVCGGGGNGGGGDDDGYEEPLPFICSHNMCEAATLDTPLSNGDIVVFDMGAPVAALGNTSVAAAAAAAAAAPAVHVPDGEGGNGMSGVVTPPTRQQAWAVPHERAATTTTTLRPSREAQNPHKPSHEAVDLVDGCLLDDMRWKCCEHCMPLPGDAVVCTLQPKPGGAMTGIVHRASDASGHMSRCKRLRKQLAEGAQLLSSGESMCELVEGAFEADRWLTTSIVIFLRHEPGALLAATGAVTAASRAILDVTSQTNPANATHPTTCAFQFRVQLSSLQQLGNLMASLDQLPQVLHVQRNTLEMMLEESADAFWRRSYEGAAGRGGGMRSAG